MSSSIASRDRLGGFHAEKRVRSGAGMVRICRLGSNRDGMGRAHQETFTHGWILYTLFDPIVNLFSCPLSKIGRISIFWRLRLGRIVPRLRKPSAPPSV